MVVFAQVPKSLVQTNFMGGLTKLKISFEKFFILKF